MKTDEHEELVAYLDGEVTAVVRSAIEERLARDATYRETLRELQDSWQLLDRLPSAIPNHSFTRTTISMVASDMQSDQVSAKVAGRRMSVATRKGWLRVAGVALAAVAGFGIVYLRYDQEHERQLRDLPVAQNLDLYRYVDSIEFLRLLDESAIFAEEADDGL